MPLMDLPMMTEEDAEERQRAIAHNHAVPRRDCDACFLLWRLRVMQDRLNQALGKDNR